jgi:hypothetical protein
MKKSKNRPYSDMELEDMMLGEAGSANDCTGLIPSGVYYGAEYESYCEVCDFSAGQDSESQGLSEKSIHWSKHQ